MFGGRSKLIREAIETATKPIQERLNAAEHLLEMMHETMQSRPVLIAIESEGRTLKLTFVRNGKLTQIETMSLLSADVPGWRKELLEPLP